MAVQAPERFGLPMCGLQDCWMVNNPVPGFEADFCFTTFQDPHEQPNLLLQQQISSQNFGFDYNRGASSSSSTCDSFLSMSLSQSLDAHLEMQRQEVDRILQVQNERLRSGLQEQRKQQLAILLKSVESKAFSLMRQKEEDLARARKKTMELEASLRKSQMESESWQRIARENEAVVVDLSNTLEQVRDRLILVNNSCQDAESFCRGSCHQREQKEEENCQKKMACQRCNSRSSCVLFLPCRHLCSCKSCEAFLGSCPVCKSAKEASMEIFWV